MFSFSFGESLTLSTVFLSSFGRSLLTPLYSDGQWRTEGVGVQHPPHPTEISKFWQSRTGLQIERKMFSVPIPTS